MARLGDYISEYSVRNNMNENIPVYSVTNSNGFCSEYFSKEVASADKTTYKIVPRGCFAYNPSRINVGSVDWLRHEERVIVSPLYVVFSVKNALNPQYLYYYLKSDIAGAFIKSLSRGSVRDNLRLETLMEFSVHVPSLNAQAHIANTLDKIVELIALRKQQLTKLDELVKSRFIELFGDPVYNSKELPTERGIDFFKLSNGKFVPESRRFESGIPAYGGNGISWFTDDAITQKDTLVVGRVGFQSGNIHFAKGPLWITDNAMYISDYNADKYDLIFLNALMERIDFTRFQDAGDLKKITQKPFMNMEYILPTLSQQHEYVAFVAQTDKSKFEIQKSLDKLEILKKALMQKYFE